MNGFQIGSKRLKVQHKRIAGQPGGGGGMIGNMPMMGGIPDHMMSQRNVMLHQHHQQSNLGNPHAAMMNKLGGHELGISPFGNASNNPRFDYPGQQSGNPGAAGNGGMPTPYHMMQQPMNNRPNGSNSSAMPYQAHGLEMDSFSLQEYMPSTNSGKHL